MQRVLITVLFIFLFWVLLPGILVGAAYLLDQGLTSDIAISSTWMLLGGVVLLIAVVMLCTAIIQFRHYGKELPISALPPDMLIQKGLFAVWRHPIYLFSVLMFTGIALVIRSGGMIFIVMPIYAVLVRFYVFLEERGLIRRFGQTYINYRERTSLVIPQLEFLLMLPVRLLFRLLFKFKALHRERIPAQSPFFVVGAHRSYLDAFLLVLALGQRISFVSTIEAYRRPLSAYLFRKFDAIPKRRFQTDTLTMRGIIRHLRQDGIVGIFPEGERSWTGRTQSWKPEVVRLFQAFPEIPILPARIEGNYHIWPRWASGFRRAYLRITFMEPVTAQPDQSLDELEALLRDRVEPEDVGITCRKKSFVDGIWKVLYRCPLCRSFTPMQTIGPDRFTCPSCLQSYDLLPDYTVQYHRAEQIVHRSLQELYDEIRITPADLTSDADTGPGSAPLVECSSVMVHQEQDNRLIPQFTGQVVLMRGMIEFRNDENAVALSLCDLRSVTIESNNKLQIYDGVHRTLHQLTFLQESALKWQDFLIESIRQECGFEPNSR